MNEGACRTPGYLRTDKRPGTIQAALVTESEYRDLKHDIIHCARYAQIHRRTEQGLAPEAVVATIVKVQFQKAGRLYDFLTGELAIQKDDMVIVETDRGKLSDK